MGIVQGGLIQAVLPRMRDIRAVFWGLVLNTTCLVAFGIAGEAWVIWVLISISAVGAIVSPAMQGVSRAADDDQQGDLQGVLSSISSLSMILSPLMMTQAFYWFTREGAGLWLPGAPFLLVAVLMGGASVIFAGLRRVGEAVPTAGE